MSAKLIKTAIGEVLMKLSEAAKILNVSPTTVRYYCNTGKLEYERTPGGQRTVTEEQLNKFLISIGREPLSTPTDDIAFYVRSSSGNKQLIQAQIEELTQAYGTPAKIYKDSASGLNEKRPGLKQLLNALAKGKYKKVCITYPDRITRFGITYLENIINIHGAELIILHADKKTSAEQELLQDFMALIASFSGKFYRLRGYKQQHDLLNMAEDELKRKEDAHNA